MKDKMVVTALLPLLKHYPWSVPAIVALGILSSLAEGLGISLFVPFLQSWDQSLDLSAGGNFLIYSLSQLFSSLPTNQRLLIIPLFMFGSVLLKNFLAYINMVLLTWLNSSISHRLRSATFDQLLSISGSYLDTRDSGRLLNTLATETWRTGEALETFIKLIINACTVFVFASLLLLISWPKTLLIGALITLVSIGTRLLMRRAKVLGKQAVESNADLAKRIHEGLIGIREIWAFGRADYEQKRFDRSSKRVATTFRKLGMLSNAVNPLYEVLSAFVVLGVLVVGLLQDRTSLPVLLTFLFMLYRLQPQAQQLEGNWVKMLALAGSVKELMSFLDRSDKFYIRSGQIPFKGLQKAISLESVSFRYNPQDSHALRNVSIVIPQGKTTALVGPSGGGKSTLVNLVCRFYDVIEGEIYADAWPLRKLDLASWRSRIAIVSQQSHIFNTNVLKNIAYGRLEASESEVMEAAKQAHAHDFIVKLPDAYYTDLGDRGVRLSGGQRQRIALARAILRNPEILILDEATSAVDSISEHLIQEALNAFRQNRTVMIIAHQFSTIQKADQIIVLEDGHVVEQGDLPSLLQRDGLFKKLYQLQNLKT